jgi:hypothetical protein
MQAQQQVDGLNQQLQDNPEAAPQLQQQAQQIQQELNEQIQGIMEQPSIEKVMQLYRDERMRPFVLDIETDSTIAPDENAQKQRANEFLQAVGGFMVQAQPLIQAAPQAAPVLAEGLKFVASQYRAGRQLYQVIDEFADNMKQLAQQPQQPNPEQQKAQAEQAAAQQQAQIDGQKAQADAQTAQADAQEKQANAQKTMIEAQGKAQDDDLNRRVTEQKEMDAARQRQIDLDSKEATARLELQKSAEKHQQDMEIGALKIEEQKLKIRQTQVQTNATIATTKASINQKNQATANGIATAQASLDQSGDGEELDLDDGAEQRAAERADAKRAAEERHAVAFEKLSGVMESLHGAVQHMSRPKRIVRDMNGRASHVETVE